MSDGLEITALLNAASAGDSSAEHDLYVVVYGELRKIAHGNRRRWRGDETLNTTALIGEAYLKLAGGKQSDWHDRGHFYATASKAMRQILVNYAEKRRRVKRGGDSQRVPLQDEHLVDDHTAAELLYVHRALETMEHEHPRRCRVVECRVFGGMSLEETADALDISRSTVKREWASATLDLHQALGPQGATQ